MVYAQRRSLKLREKPMATQPTHPAPKPQTPPPAPAPKPADPPEAKAKVEGHAAKQPEPEPPVKTVADEQRERSEEMQREGVEAWKAAHDERSEEERQPKQVPGSQPGPNTVSPGTKGSTPEARAAQHPAAPR